MAEQSGTKSVAKAGILIQNNWSDYPSPQAFLDIIAPALEISVEGGQKGETGNAGSAGSDAPAKVFEMALEGTFVIPVGATFLDTGTPLAGKIVQIHSTDPDTQATASLEAFGVGIIEGTKVFFIFNDDTTGDQSVQRVGWELRVYKLQEQV
jgi:hypothetical protein